MSVDFTKPIRYKAKPNTLVRFLGFLHGRRDNLTIAVASETDKWGETVVATREDVLENIPQSRWLNVYQGHVLASSNMDWRNSRSECDRLSVGASHFHMLTRLGILEDKQDGSPLIFHQT